MSTFGPSELALQLAWLPLALFGAIGAFTDLWRGKIYNWLTLTMMLSGLALATAHGGWPGARDSLLGILAGFAVYGWMFACRAMGGGDVKFLMGFGAWGGAAFALETGIMGVLVGGAIALAVLIVRGRLGMFARKMSRFFFTAIVPELVVELPKPDPSLTLPFGVPIAIGALWAALAHPLAQWGLWRW